MARTSQGACLLAVLGVGQAPVESKRLYFSAHPRVLGRWGRRCFTIRLKKALRGQGDNLSILSGKRFVRDTLACSCGPRGAGLL